MNKKQLSIPASSVWLLTLLFFQPLLPASAVPSGAYRQTVSEAEALCSRLPEIKRLPFKGEAIDDEVYNKIIKQGKAIVPCLIEKITDVTKMRDPRIAPTYPDFRAGDLAFFLLVNITKTSFGEMLPDEVKDRVKIEGVYAYFRYARQPRNRTALQEKWRAWLKKQTG